MNFLFKLLGTWLLNLIAGGIVVGLFWPTFNNSKGVFPAKFIAPNSFDGFLESAFFHAGGAGITSCWLFISIFLVQLALVIRGKDYKRAVGITYWIGTTIYFVGIWFGWHDFPLFLFPYLFFGLIFFRLFLRIKLWSLGSE